MDHDYDHADGMTVGAVLRCLHRHGVEGAFVGTSQAGGLVVEHEGETVRVATWQDVRDFLGY